MVVVSEGDVMAKISIRNGVYAKSGLVDLIRYVRNHGLVHPRNMIMAEIGCYVGDSTEIFAKNFKQVYAIDPWLNGYDDGDASSYLHPMDQIERQFDELLKAHANIDKLKMPSVDAAKSVMDKSLDFVYIDGNHRYEAVLDDIRAWFPKVKRTGFIAGHDYGHKLAPGVKMAVDELLGIPDERFKETSWVIKIDERMVNL